MSANPTTTITLSLSRSLSDPPLTPCDCLSRARDTVVRNGTKIHERQTAIAAQREELANSKKRPESLLTQLYASLPPLIGTLDLTRGRIGGSMIWL
jgi:hypothetical protein